MRHITLIVTALALAVAAPAIAGKGGVPNGGGGNGGGSGSDNGGAPAKPNAYAPTLAVSWPLSLTTTSTSDTPYVIEGCGYNAGYGAVTVVVYTPVSAAFTSRWPDGSGCISVSNFSTQGSGTYRIEAHQQVRNRDDVVATTSFTY